MLRIAFLMVVCVLAASGCGGVNPPAADNDGSAENPSVTDETATNTFTDTDSSTVTGTETSTDASSSTDTSSTTSTTTSPDIATSTETVSSTATDTNTATDSSTATETDEEETSSNPLPFGFWGMNGFTTTEGLADVSERFNITVFQVSSSAPHYTADTLLPRVHDSGMKITLNMTGWHENYSISGNFDLQMWKDKLAAWQTACEDDAGDCIQSYIDDGTLIGHMLLDDIFTFTGTDPTAAELDEMARYSEELFPGLTTFVRNKASTMPIPDDGTYDYLDACVNQYTNYPGYSDGNIDDYVVQQSTTADSLGLSVINGLNLPDGGDGSSGIYGTNSRKYAMTADEITLYGEALLDRNVFPDMLMFLMWEYDGEQLWSDGVTIGSDYLDQPELQEAIFNLGELAKTWN